METRPTHELHKRGQDTSRRAVEYLAATGALTGQTLTVFEALKRWDREYVHPATSAELAQFAGLDRHMAARRVADLVRLGFAKACTPRVCNVKHNLCKTVRPLVKGEK